MSEQEKRILEATRQALAKYGHSLPEYALIDVARIVGTAAITDSRGLPAWYGDPMKDPWSYAR